MSLNWDDLRLFLAVARYGRFTAAARALEVDHTTVARRINALETSVGCALFTRSPKGASLTEHGLILSRYAERIEGEILHAVAIPTDPDRISGTVRLATPEAFGQTLVTPNIGELLEQHPELSLELSSESRAVNLVNREADISVTLTRPQQGRLIARRLTDYRVGLYASRSFLEKSGPISGLTCAAQQPFVSYVDNLLELPELAYLQQTARGARTPFRSTSIIAQHLAIANGVGVGLLHAFTASRDERLVRVLPDEVDITRTYWLTFHEDNRNIPKIRAVLDFVDAVITRNRAYF